MFVCSQLSVFLITFSALAFVNRMTITEILMMILVGMLIPGSILYVAILIIEHIYGV